MTENRKNGESGMYELSGAALKMSRLTFTAITVISYCAGELLRHAPSQVDTDAKYPRNSEAPEPENAPRPEGHSNGPKGRGCSRKTPIPAVTNPPSEEQSDGQTEEREKMVLADDYPVCQEDRRVYVYDDEGVLQIEAPTEPVVR